MAPLEPARLEHRASGRQRRWVWGPAAALGLVGAAIVSVSLGLVAGIPLFDGLAPPAPYAWLQPPVELRSTNRAPTPVVMREPLGSTGTVTVATPDGQVVVTYPASAIAAQAGQSAVQFSIEPVASSLAPSPPKGVVIEGNLYRLRAAYVPSGATATVSQPLDVVLRYPVDATQVIEDSNGSWQYLATIQESADLSLNGTLPQWGLVAAASTGVVPAAPSRLPPWAYVAAGLALVIGAAPMLGRKAASRGRGSAQPAASPESPQGSAGLPPQPPAATATPGGE